MIINNTNASSLTASPLPHPHDKENIAIVYQPLAKDIAVSNVISFFPEWLSNVRDLAMTHL